MRQHSQLGARLRAACITALVVAAVSGSAFAAEPSSSGPAVKKSSTGICHARGTAYYDQTQRFTPYPSMEACLESGGRYPKGQEPGMGPPVKKSRSEICHDRSSPSYGQTKSYTAYDTMEACLESGGRLPKPRS